MSIKIIILFLLLIIAIAVLCPSPDLVESFGDTDPATALAALDPQTQAKVTAIGDALYNNLVLYRDKHIWDCSAYVQLFDTVKRSSMANGLTAPQADAILYYVMQKDPGFFSGFNLARCTANGAPAVSSHATAPLGPHSTTSTTTISASSKQPPSNYETGRLSIGNQNQCLTVLGGNHASGNPIVQWPCSQTDPNQVLAVDRSQVAEPLQFRSNANKNLCMASGGDQNGSRVMLQPCDSNNSLQRWQYDGKALHVRNSTGRCMDLNNGIRVNNGPVQIWDCNGYALAQGVKLV